MTVYVVTSGEYSDYHICSIFSTPEGADEYVKYQSLASEYCENFYVHPYELDMGLPNQFKDVTMYLYNGVSYTTVEIQDLFNMIAPWDKEIDKRLGVVKGVSKISKDYIDSTNRLFDDNYPGKISYDFYIVNNVPYNKNRDIMDKSVFDRVAEFKSLELL